MKTTTPTPQRITTPSMVTQIRNEDKKNVITPFKQRLLICLFTFIPYWIINS